MTKLVSIITPCHNAGSLISHTIASVLSQTYKSWELIIVDDSSTDDSNEIIRHYANIDSRIRHFVTAKPSGSPSHPRNIGIENAHGTYIAFLDADDIWLPDKLGKQVTFMEKNNIHVSYSYYEKMSWDGHLANRLVTTNKKTTYRSLLKSNSIPCLTSMVTKEAIGKTRFKQIPQEDFCFWLDILKKGYVAYNMCENTALYRVAKDSRSSNKLDMFKGYWNVIHNHQHIPFLKCCYYMTTYSFKGLAKYLK